MVMPSMRKSCTSAVRPTSPSEPGSTMNDTVLELPAFAAVPPLTVTFSQRSESSVIVNWSR